MIERFLYKFIVKFNYYLLIIVINLPTFAHYYNIMYDVGTRMNFVHSPLFRTQIRPLEQAQPQNRHMLHIREEGNSFVYIR